jgi:ATP-dependent DNA helicase Rep
VQTLNPQQQAAVKITDRPLLVLAGAGSGKTRVITEKIAYLIRQGLPAKHIAAITFTNKAAREMKARVGKLLDQNQIRGIRISTFHSLGLDIIRREYKTLGYKSGLTLFDDQDKATLLRNLIGGEIKDCSVDHIDNYIRQISQWKSQFLDAKKALATVSAEQYPIALLYQQLTTHLAAYNAVDFDDLIFLPVRLLQQHPEIQEKWQNKIRYLLVDEYQDTNNTQYQLVKLLTGKLGRLTVVGDDDQSIYSWRGAQPENLMQLQKDFARIEVIKLEQNYRSTGRILKVANHLIANNPHAFEKQLWSKLSYGDPIRVLSHKDEISEAQQIVSEIIHHKFKTGSGYSDYSILYRSNHQSRIFERVLRENNIPYFISGNTSFFAYAEIKDILAYCRLFVNQDDDAAFLRIINTPRREIGPSTLEKLATYANARSVSLFAASQELGLSQQLSERATDKLQRFCHWVLATSKRIAQEDTFKVIAEVIDYIDYQSWLKANSKTQQAAERKISNVNDLIEWLKKLADQDDGELPLDEVIAKVMLLDILERNEEDAAGEQVSLMTLHAAKGLEFTNVYLIGFEENLLPHQNSVDTGNIEEERRLAYVGITRAQRQCTLSYCTHRKRYGEMTESGPSRFIAELPADDLDWPGRSQSTEQQKARGKANLAQLKNMLA